MANLKKIIVGEEMPDKDDPKYKGRYEKEVEAGRKFARATRLDRMAARIQAFASNHRKLFLGIVFGFVIGCFLLNIFNMAKAYRLHEQNRGAVMKQEQVLRDKLHKSHPQIPQDNGMDKKD